MQERKLKRKKKKKPTKHGPSMQSQFKVRNDDIYVKLQLWISF